MPELYITSDTAGTKEFAANIIKAKRAMIGQLGERGYQLLRKEVPKVTGNLEQGVAPPDVDYEKLQALLTVSARSAALGARSAEIFNKDGKQTKTVTLKPSPAFNYAEVIARGRKSFTAKGGRLGPKGQRPIGPGLAHSLIIPVTSRPSNEGYMMVGGQVYVFRRWAKAVPPNPYDERAAKTLGAEAAGIGEAILRKYFI